MSKCATQDVSREGLGGQGGVRDASSKGKGQRGQDQAKEVGSCPVPCAASSARSMQLSPGRGRLCGLHSHRKRHRTLSATFSRPSAGHLLTTHIPKPCPGAGLGWACDGHVTSCPRVISELIKEGREAPGLGSSADAQKTLEYLSGVRGSIERSAGFIHQSPEHRSVMESTLCPPTRHSPSSTPSPRGVGGWPRPVGDINTGAQSNNLRS